MIGEHPGGLRPSSTIIRRSSDHQDLQHQRLTVPARFSGPPGSANGGYAAGCLAAQVFAPAGSLGSAVMVTLRQPPPLDTPMDVTPWAPVPATATAGGVRAGVRALFGGAVIAEAVPTALHVDPVDPVRYETAEELAAGYAGWTRHPFPGCFACGSDRRPPDGLGLRPSRLPDRPDCTAAAWVPDRSVAEEGTDRVATEIAWSALDCPGGWTIDVPGRPAVLGRMTAQVDALPWVSERCLVMGRLLGREGRKSYSATTLYDGDGRVLGRAHAVWLEVDASAAGRR